jgi:hypothetical protein
VNSKILTSGDSRLWEGNPRRGFVDWRFVGLRGLRGSAIVHKRRRLRRMLVDVTGIEPATSCLQIQKADLDREKKNEKE